MTNQDTSVIGGVFDNEFELWTNIFFDQVNNGEFKVVVSELLFLELEEAPEHVKSYIDTISENQVLTAIYDDEAKFLAEAYLKAGIVGPGSLMDCRHIATATVNNIRILASWNY